MIIVTGANGFIGSCLVAELEHFGCGQIVAVDTIFPAQRPELLRGRSIKKFVASNEIFNFLDKQNPTDIEIIFHMGACSSTTETNEVYLKNNNTEFTKKLFEYCTQKKVNFIYASSAAVYGAGENGFDDSKQSFIYKPLNLYGWSKLTFDIWAEQQIQTPPRWAGLRFFNVFGPNEYHKGEMSSVVFKAFQQIQKTGRLRLFKSHRDDYQDGQQVRDFIYIKDVTRWMVRIWQQKKFTNGIYNMGYGTARTWLDLATAVFSSLKKETIIDWIDIPPNIRGQYQYFTEAKMDRLFAQGLSQPQFQLEAAVQDYINNHLLSDIPYL